MFPFHFHFQLSKDVRTRLEISKCWIPWICCVVVLRSMKVNRQMLMSLSRSQGLFILGERRWVIYLSFFWRFQFDFIDAEYLIQFHNLALLFKKTFRFRKSSRMCTCAGRLRTRNTDTETHAAFCKSNIHPLYVSVLNSPSFLKWDIPYSLICLLYRACCVFHLLFSAFCPPFHGLPYLYLFSFFSHSFIRPNLSPVRYTVFLLISTNALGSAFRRTSAHP